MSSSAGKVKLQKEDLLVLSSPQWRAARQGLRVCPENELPRFRNAPACGAQTRGSKTLEPRRKGLKGRMDMHALALGCQWGSYDMYVIF